MKDLLLLLPAQAPGLQQKLQQEQGLNLLCIQLFLKMAPALHHISYPSKCLLVFLATAALMSQWQHRKSRQMIERGQCNLPVIVQRSRLAKFFGFGRRSNELARKQSPSVLDRMLARTIKQKSQYGMYGQILGLSTRLIYISHPTPARAVLSKTRSKAPAYDSFQDMSGDGVFSTDGELWKAKRTSIVHCLLRGLRYKQGLGRLEQEANHAVDCFFRSIKKEQQLQESESDVFDIVPFLQNATNRFIYTFITHHDIDQLCIDPSSSSSSTAFFKSYLHSLTNIRLIIREQSRSFWFLLPRWVYRAISPLFRLEKATLQPIHKFARIACLNAQPGSPLALLRERPSHSSATTNALDHETSKAMVDEAVTLLFAGQDTSAATLSWTMHLLSLHPSIQEKLAMEIREKCQDQCCSDDSLFTKDFVIGLTYLDAVIKESMRLYPVAPYVIRNLTQDTSIPPEDSDKADISTVLPKGSLAFVSIYALHRNPKLWHRASDFVPERWIDPKLKDLDEGQQSGAYMPFAYGPRNCVGQDVARIVLRIFLARIVSTWVIIDKRLDCGIAKEEMMSQSELRKHMQVGFTVLPSGGVHLHLQPRPSTQA